MNSDELFTGERFVPGIQDHKLEIEHFQRYLSVCRLVKGKQVLDAACGEGYGSSILAETAKEVIGVDIDECAVSRARKLYENIGNLSFQQGNIEKLNLQDHSIDVVVSFETIEHVDEETQKKFLYEIDRVLKVDGILIISTPNKAVYSDLHNYQNKFHIKEFYHDEFLQFLHEKFQFVQLYNQAFRVLSVIDCCAQNDSNIAYYNKNVQYNNDGKYYIALASHKEIREASLSCLYVDNLNEYEENIARISALQKEVENRNIHIKGLDDELYRRELTIQTLQKENSERNDHIKSLDREIDKSGEVIRELQRENTDRNRHIAHLDIVIQQNEHEIEEQKRIRNSQFDLIVKKSELISQQALRIKEQTEKLNKNAEQNIKKDEQIEQLTKTIKQQNKEIDEYSRRSDEYKQKIAEMSQTILNMDGHIELLLEVERAYEREKRTHSYRIGKRIQRIGDFILPPNSRRRFFLRIMFNIFRHPLLMIRVINPKRIKNYIKYMKLEGMVGVKKRYEEAVDIERMQVYPTIGMELDLEEVRSLANGDAQSIEKFERIIFPRFEKPKVSIIIPVYNKFHYTYKCLKSILKNSGDISYEIIIADDCSTDLTRDIKKVVGNIKVVTTKDNMRFLLNCNNAAKYAEGMYILFLNNDTQVQDNWLEPLVNLIESNDKIGMVGSKLVYPDGRLQEAGGILWKDGSAWNYGNSKNPEDSEFNYVKEVDYISGAAIMIRKKLWDEIGGFDERFAPAYCEDSDLAFEVRKRGYKVIYQPLSVVVHFEGVSNGTNTESGLKAYQVENQQKFMDKWKRTLESEHFPNAENVFVARDRSRNKKVLLMIDHYVPQYDKDAGSRTVFQYLRMFVNKGYNVKFIGDNFYRHEPYTTVLQQMGVEILYGPYYANNWKEWIRDNKEFFTYVFLNRPHIAINYIDFIKDNTNARVVYYGHDLHFLREMRKYELTSDKKALSDSKDWKEKELYLMRKADVVYYPSHVEVDEIAKIDQSIGAKAIVAYIFENVVSKRYRFNNRKDIMFVGGFTHTPNVDAVLWFAREILPKVINKLPDIKLYVMGSNPPLEIQKLESKNIVVKGFVSDEELQQYYENCRISVVPLRYGAGIKGKVIEAMRYGIPVETTSVGAEGIEEAENILSIENDAEMFAERLIELYNDRAKLEKLSKESYKYICNNFSEEKAWKIIEKDFS